VSKRYLTLKLLIEHDRGYHYGKDFNYGDLIDICAPGEKIFSTLPGNEYSDISNVKNSGSSYEEIKYWNGTSMAAPHVSGVAAMCFSVNPDLTGPQVEDNELIASLDWDDTSSYGPETVTVTVSIDMETCYKYYVYDFSNGGNASSTALSYSGAKVNVYCGDKLVKAYSVPTDKVGYTWDVFEIFKGEVIDINQIK